MSELLPILCNDCDVVYVKANDIKLIQVLDHKYFEEGNVFGHFLATCACPGCALKGHPNQLTARVNKDTREALISYGVEIVQYNPHAQHFVPGPDSFMGYMLNSPRRIQKALQRIEDELRLFFRNNPGVTSKVFKEIDEISMKMDLREFDRLKAKQNRPRISSRVNIDRSVLDPRSLMPKFSPN